jgi:hypothetical protein
MGASATGLPLFPAGYVAGTITLGDSAPHQLLALIQAQLDANCPGAGQEVTIQADGSGPVYVGRQTTLGGVLSTSNYGYVLDKANTGFVAGASRTYRSSFPGNNSPVGDLMVLMSGGGTFHVEVA